MTYLNELHYQRNRLIRMFGVNPKGNAGKKLQDISIKIRDIEFRLYQAMI